jgi:hypothetical protein
MASGKRKIIVNPPNRSIASFGLSKRDKLTEVAIPRMGHGAMTKSELSSIFHGKVTGGEF